MSKIRKIESIALIVFLISFLVVSTSGPNPVISVLMGALLPIALLSSALGWLKGLTWLKGRFC